MHQPKLTVLSLVLFYHGFCNLSFSQCAVSAMVTDSLKEPVPFITVALLKEDSSIYKGEITR
ncbi:MAG: hypothetical protein KGZ74_19265, partial [Chitinophagaceae bacterium]|nr:hypothetical protein [Chitinophagaceae bacterium]